MAIQSKEEFVRESMNSPKKIDTSIDFKIPRSAQQFDEKIHKHKCSCCGHGFTTKKNNFQKSNSPLFQSDDGYLPWCKDCSDKYFLLLAAMYYGNQYHAIEHFCQQADWVYEENPLVAARETESGHRDRSILSHYAAKKNLNTYGRKTYTDTIKYNFENKKDNIIENLNDLEESDARKLQKNISKWGASYSPEEFIMLNEHYKLYKDRIDEDDPSQVTLLRNLCEQYIIQARCIKEKDIDKYDKVSKLYQQTLNNANLKPKSQETNTNNPDECWGNFIKIVENICPTDYYKDKSIFEDNDQMDEYYRRFVERSTNNLIDGTTNMDEEFSIKATNDE